MGDEQKKKSSLPFSAPVSNTPAKPTVHFSTGSRAGKRIKPKSTRKQLKEAKKNPKSALNVRRLVVGLLILVATAGTVTAITSPQLISKVVSDGIINRTEVCEVTEVNVSAFFDTTCGRFEWDAEKTPGSPSANLVEGVTYTFTSSGLRAAPVKLIPSIDSYVEGGIVE